jgi:hypothetical protein
MLNAASDDKRHARIRLIMVHISTSYELISVFIPASSAAAGCATGRRDAERLFFPFHGEEEIGPRGSGGFPKGKRLIPQREVADSPKGRLINGRLLYDDLRITAPLR